MAYLVECIEQRCSWATPSLGLAAVLTVAYLAAVVFGRVRHAWDEGREER